MPPLSPIRSYLRVLGYVESILAVSTVATIVLIILAQVFSRYVLGRPLIWAEELATYLLIWLGFLSASVALKMKRHITIRTFDAFVSERARQYASAFAYLCAAAALVAVILYIPDAMRTERLKTTVGLPVDIGLHWFFTVPTLVACISMTATSLFYVAASLLGDTHPLLALPADPSLEDDIGLGDTAQEAHT